MSSEQLKAFLAKVKGDSSLQKKLKVDAITEAMGASANKVELSYCVQ